MSAKPNGRDMGIRGQDGSGWWARRAAQNEHYDVHCSCYGIAAGGVLSKVNSVTSRKPTAMKPTPSRPAGVDGEKRRVTQRAARIVTTNMTDVSISSAVLVPMLPRTKPIPNTVEKYRAQLSESA